MTARGPLSWLRRAPLLAALFASGAIALLLWGLGLDLPARWVAGVSAGAIGAWQVVRLIRQFRRGHWGLDVLAILAIGATLWLGDVAAGYVVAVMIVGGQAIERAAEQRAQRTLAALLERVPRVAHRMDGDELADVPVDAVAVGDRLRVRVGEAVPADASLLDPEADLDESSLTGESLPVAVTRGAEIPSGSIVLGRAITVRVLAAPADSQYQRIVALVEAAASTKGRFIRLADRVAVPFTVAALVIAGAAWLISGDPVRFAQVLVVATPCPLLVAAPTALMAGLDRAAREGVVVKGGDAFERLASASTVLFDKTGTLTVGHPELVRVDADPATPYEAATILAIAAAAEEHSTHVLADAIVAGARERNSPAVAVHDIRETIGQGMTGIWEGHQVRIGRAAFTGAEPVANAPGEVAVHVVIDDVPAGRIILADELRPDAAEAVAQLRELGFGRIAMLTGDGAANAHHLAADAGIDEVYADLRPEGKVEIAGASTHTLMVGDGVNDAPVLAASDVGIAIGLKGATAASETADAVLLVPELVRIPGAVRTARRTMRIARQSVAGGVGLSLVLMAIAATGVIPALFGALAQEAVDVLTILNGLRAARAARRPPSAG
ncbi:MAG TPA: heavy metal translocating P-type ATPase [Pseudolysinimonas sp.]|jgi:heavy metal translocating P-type ATPase|nr:heavy metal translocating P-type ATPase [Pseudolysinimonas sp.]